MKPPNIWRIFSSFFRHVIISKNAGQPAEQQARLIAMPSRGCSSAQAKERFIFFLIMWAPRRGAVLHKVMTLRRRGAAGGLYVFYYECYVARVEGVYLSGGIGEVMTHYVGRTVEGDEGVVVKVYCFARC